MSVQDMDGVDPLGDMPGGDTPDGPLFQEMGFPPEWENTDGVSRETSGLSPCDQVAALETLQRHVEDLAAMVTAQRDAINQLGAIVQYMSDGTATLFGVMASIGQDLKEMSLMDKMKLLKEMLGNGN